MVFDDDDFYASDYVSRMVNILREKKEQKLVKFQDWVMLSYMSNAATDDVNKATRSFNFIYPIVAREFGWGFSFVFFKNVYPACKYAETDRVEEDPFAECIEKTYGAGSLRRLMQNDHAKQLVLKLDSKRRI